MNREPEFQQVSGALMSEYGNDNIFAVANVVAKQYSFYRGARFWFTGMFVLSSLVFGYCWMSYESIPGWIAMSGWGVCVLGFFLDMMAANHKCNEILDDPAQLFAEVYAQQAVEDYMSNKEELERWDEHNSKDDDE